MSWRAITEDDIRAAITAPEDEAYRAQLLTSGQTDPLETIKAQVTLQVRESIRSCAKNKLHANATFIPEGAIFNAVAIIRHRLLTRFAIGEQDQPGESRRDEYREALRWLERVESCKVAIENPDGDGSESGPGGGQMEQITPARRRADREGLKGL
jgi:phage gp36-like protein